MSTAALLHALEALMRACHVAEDVGLERIAHLVDALLGDGSAGDGGVVDEDIAAANARFCFAEDALDISLLRLIRSDAMRVTADFFERFVQLFLVPAENEDLCASFGE